MSELEKFLEERAKIPIPPGDVAQVRLLTKELVLGVHRGLWSADLSTMQSDTLGGEFVPWEKSLQEYLKQRWDDVHIGHKKQLLRIHGYLDELTDRNGRNYTRLSSVAVALLDEPDPYNIFISYRRLDSSALALLVLARLKEHSLVPFVDMALEAGGNWHADLEERINACDYFIILLGKETLSSPMTVKEIQWAIQHSKTIIPVWHSGFDLKAEKWNEVEERVKCAIRQTNAIRVTDESASGYNTAIVELLNRFGITP